MKRATLVLSLLLAGSFAFAAQERDRAKEAPIEERLREINPALVEPFQQATVAMDKGDTAEAVRLLEPVTDKAPNFDVAQRRLALTLAQRGQRAEALPHAEKAVHLQRDAANLFSLAYVVAFAKDYRTAAEEKDRALSLLQEAVRLPGGSEPENLVPLALLAAQLNNPAVLASATEKLQQQAPELMQTHYFSAIVAANQEHWIRAKREILRAKALGLPDAEVEYFLASGVGWYATAWQTALYSGWAIAGWAAGLVALCVLGAALSKITLRHIEKGDALLAVSPGEHRLRRVYRAVLNVAGIYYYLSLPVVLLLVVGVCGGLVLLFLMVGHIPIKLVALLIIGALLTVWSMLRSLFLRIPTVDPGRVLAREEAEALWRTAEEVAAELHTRPVDEIRITGGTDLCVYERGSWREKLQNCATRVLVLGTALLPEFQQRDFRCVLAHEYGHFSYRDTAGGDVAMRVQNDMMKFYYAMRGAGQATTWNLAFQFLRLYNFIFRRISHGATRLQEVLADRVAAQTYGAVAFEGGLRHVITQGLRFEMRAHREIGEAIQSARPLRNLYELPPAEPDSEETALQKALHRPTTADDTHPGPLDRFRYLTKVPPPDRPAVPGVVWDLFHDPAAIMQEMIEKIEKQVASHRKYPAPSA